MERYTQKERLAGHIVSYVDGDACFDVWSAPKKFMGTAIDRLAAYEDTGLEPGEVLTGVELADICAGMLTLAQYQSIGTVEEFRDLRGDQL